MDGLGAAASIIAVLQIAQSIGSALKDYYEDVRDAREDIRKLYDSVRSLETILSTAQSIVRREGHLLNAALFTDTPGPLKQSELELEKLRDDLKPRTHFAKKVQSLTWPFKKNDTEKTVVAIDRHKSNLTLEIGIESLWVLRISRTFLIGIEL
jgi:hypothetical protein